MEAEREEEVRGPAVPNKREAPVWREWENEEGYLTWKEEMDRFFASNQRDYAMGSRFGAQNRAAFIASSWTPGSIMRTDWESGKLTNHWGDSRWVTDLLGPANAARPMTVREQRSDPALRPVEEAVVQVQGMPESNPDKLKMELARGEKALGILWDALDLRGLGKWAHKPTRHQYPEPVSGYVARYLRRWKVRVLFANERAANEDLETDGNELRRFAVGLLNSTWREARYCHRETTRWGFNHYICLPLQTLMKGAGSGTSLGELAATVKANESEWLHMTGMVEAEAPFRPMAEPSRAPRGDVARNAVRHL
jgi:hypothetical protein